MSCILTIKQLVAYLDDVADEQVVKHIHRCAHCQRKAGELERAQERFAAKLFGHSCPTAMELGEYHLRTLKGRQAQRIRTHLRQCRACYRKLNELQRFVGHDPIFRVDIRPVPTTIHYPYVAVAMSDYSANAAVGVRGSEENEAYRMRGSGENEDLTYKISESEINIQIQESDSKLGHKTIWVLPVGLETDEILSAELKALDSSQASISQEVEAGMFTIEDVLPGEYDLLLNRAESAILLRDLKV